MTENPQKKLLLSKLFDLNGNGKIDPAEAALIMMVMDDVDKKETPVKIVKNNTIDIDDMDIKGIQEDIRLCRF